MEYLCNITCFGSVFSSGKQKQNTIKIINSNGSAAGVCNIIKIEWHILTWPHIQISVIINIICYIIIKYDHAGFGICWQAACYWCYMAVSLTARINCSHCWWTVYHENDLYFIIVFIKRIFLHPIEFIKIFPLVQKNIFWKMRDLCRVKNNLFRCMFPAEPNYIALPERIENKNTS